MTKIRRRILLAAIPAVYLGFFFMLAPARMAAVEWRAYSLLRPISAYDSVAHQWWVSRLADDNWIVKLRAANTIWWCHQFETCTLK